MKLFEQLQFLSRLDGLIRRKSTGSPQELASRLEISERKVYRLIQDLKNMGLPVVYCHGRGSYTYDGNVKIRFEILVDDTEQLKINGGEKKINFFHNIFSTDKKWQERAAYL